jgi:predicted transposase/invertase (TIGR01784 family)
VSRLDPKIDFVFKQLLTRERALLGDMLAGVLGRDVGMPTLLDPGISGELKGDKSIAFDVRAVLEDGSHADVEMQARIPWTLASRLAYYGARDYTTQLRRGEDYELLTSTAVVAWLVKPLFSSLERRHSIFELRERHTNFLFSGHLAIHLIQLSKPHVPSPSRLPCYDARVERWARFFTVNDDAELDRLASEDPIMHLAKQTLEELSQDPDIRRRALEREDEIKLYKIDLLGSRLQGRAECLLKQLQHRFGRLSDAIRARVEAGRPAELDAWSLRVLTAQTLDEVLAR